MNTSTKKNKLSCFGIGCLGSMALLLVFALFMSAGELCYGETSLLTPVLIGAGILYLIYIVLQKTSKNYQTAAEDKEERKQGLAQIAKRYNKEIRELEAQFKEEKTALGLSGFKETKLGREYDERYGEKMMAFRTECKNYVKEWNNAHPNAAHVQKTWKTGIGIGLAVIFMVFSFMFGLTIKPEPEVSPLMQKAESRTWNADQLPNVHIEDGSKYVINPDSILSEAVVDSMNLTLYRLDHELNIESAVVIVGHIEGDDPIPMVRGIYNRFGVGRDNRGLVIVVGYLDHSYFIAPGRNLEADLTDTETDMLAKKYLIPSMKAEKPDSGMLYLVNGTYALMAEKELPRMSALTSSADSNKEEDEGANIMLILGLIVVLIGGWAYAGYKKFSLMGWNDSGFSNLANSPFEIYRPSSDSSSSSGGGYSSSSSSHSSGGSYGGGSWGGGGSGGRW